MNPTQRPDLTPDLVQDIVVRATPNAGGFINPTQQLLELGVLDDWQASLHSARVQSSLNAIGWHVRRADIDSAPTASVSACTDSVLDNAF